MRRPVAVTVAALPDLQSVAAVETFRLGSFTIAHSTNSGAVVGLNAAAARLLRWLTRQCMEDAAAGHARASQGVSEAVAGDIGAALEQWTRAGLFKDRPPMVAADAGANAVFAWQKRLSLHRRSITVRSSSAAAGMVLQQVLAPLVDSPSAAMADGSVDFVEAEGRYHIIANGEPYWSCADFAGGRHMLLQAVLETALGPVGAVLHAGAVEMEPGQTVILAGTSGAGKSTLVSQIVLAGGRYLGDDLVALSPSGARVFGLPASISIKPGSARVLARQFAGRALSGADDYGLRYWRPEPVQAWRKPALLCFPRFCRGMTGAEARPLEPMEALGRLLQAGGRPCGPGNSLAAMVRLCRTVPAIALEHGGGGAAIDQLRHHLHNR